MFNFKKLFRKKEEKLLGDGRKTSTIKSFIEKIEDIICVLDSEFRIEYINKPNIDTNNYLSKKLGCNENNALYNEIISTVKKEGFYSNNIEITNENEQKTMYIAMFYIEEKDKYIVYIKDTNEHLKKEIILQEKLSKTEEELRDKSLFLANVSHEIRTPINIIVSMIYFLKATRLDELQNEYINKLESASDLLIELVNNVLNVTKSNKIMNVTNAKEKFILKDLIDKVYSIFKDAIDEKNIQWTIESNFDLNIEIYADKIRLEQIFINLISNSVKYTQKGFIEFGIVKLKEDVNSYKLRFCVKDTGIGIKKEDSIKIFKEFEQNSDPTIKEQEGFGLGLPLIRKIIESMNGKIWLESSYGLGSKFFVELDLQKKPNNEEEKTEDKCETGAENIQMQTNKVLIVDDNKIISEITEKILKEIDLECDIALDGQEAIRIVEEKGSDYYGVILMDIHMPKYNGYDISRIMKDDFKVKTPIVALTATNIDENIIEQNKKYISFYIQKPVKPEELKHIIKNMLTKGSTKVKNKTKRETILFVADKIKDWEIVQHLGETYNVICTLDKKDINIIESTKELAAVIIDKTEKDIEIENIENSTNNMILFLEYDMSNGKQENISITDMNGYTKKVNDISMIKFLLTEILEKNKKVSNIESTIQGYNSEISEVYKFLYDSLVNLTTIRSKETGAHLMRTQEYIKEMIKEYERAFQTGQFENMKKIEDIGIAATLHDIGKVGIPDEILNKPGKLSEEEFNRIKDHTRIGYQILENTNSDKISDDVLEYAKEITLHHHEKFDGTGYPDGLKESEISLISKIMAVIDVYDALVNERVYKNAMKYEDAEEYIISQSGKAFDPKIVNVFINIKENLRKINEKYKENKD